MADAGPVHIPALGPPLAALVDDLADGTRILGWSEGVHNRTEYLVARNAVVAHLVLRGSVRTIAVESNLTRSRAVDGYLRGDGPEEPADAVVHGVWSWNRAPLQENLTLLRWLRRHNATQTPQRRVRFFGLDMFGDTDTDTSPVPLPDDADADARFEAALRERRERHRAAGRDHRDIAVRDGAQYDTLCHVTVRRPPGAVLVFEQVDHLDRRIRGSLGWHLARNELGPFRAVAAVWRHDDPTVTYPIGHHRGLSEWIEANRQQLIGAPLGTGVLDLRPWGSAAPDGETALVDAARAFDAVLHAPTLSPAHELHRDATR